MQLLCSLESEQGLYCLCNLVSIEGHLRNECLFFLRSWEMNLGEACDKSRELRSGIFTISSNKKLYYNSPRQKSFKILS